MAGGCRDCSRCTEPGLVGLLLAIPRLLWWLATFWNIGMVWRNCPQCGHLMSQHAKRADGSFKD